MNAKFNRSRRPLRLKNYNYSSQGAYFVTICSYQREPLFGQVVNEEMKLNETGRIVESVWYDLSNHYFDIELDQFVVMPNHIHGIIVLRGSVEAGLKPAPTRLKNHGLPEIVRALKTFSSRAINLFLKTPKRIIWQRGYFEHVIRDEEGLNKIREYIINNPFSWPLDRENQARIGVNDFDKYFIGIKNQRDRLNRLWLEEKDKKPVCLNPNG
jgi:putative transposase